MSDAVLVALITGSLTLIGVIITELSSNKSISRDIKDIKAENKDQSLAILRLTVMNAEMPISERIAAGELYVHKGGNGDVKHYYERLLEEHTK